MTSAPTPPESRASKARRAQSDRREGDGSRLMSDDAAWRSVDVGSADKIGRYAFGAVFSFPPQRAFSQRAEYRFSSAAVPTDE